MKTVRFNVSGTAIEIPVKLLKKFPNSTLHQYVGQEFFDRPYFLDINPYAFLVIIDYMKTDELFVPRNVNSDLIKKLLREFNIPYTYFLETETEAVLPKQKELSTSSLPRQTTLADYTPLIHSSPPAYETSPQLDSHISPFGEKAVPSWLQPETTPLQTSNAHYTHHLDSQERIMYKKIEPLVFKYILPLISNHVEAGHSRLRIYICPPEVKKESIANDTKEEDVGFPKEYFSLRPEDGSPELLFVTQPKVVDLMKKTISYATGIRNMYANIKNVTTRSENLFGLIESKSFDLLMLSFEIPPNCAF